MLPPDRDGLVTFRHPQRTPAEWPQWRLDCADAIITHVVHSYSQRAFTLSRRINILLEFPSAVLPRLLGRCGHRDPYHFSDRVHHLAIRAVQ
jgi:hypothetical protein